MKNITIDKNLIAYPKPYLNQTNGMRTTKYNNKPTF